MTPSFDPWEPLARGTGNRVGPPRPRGCRKAGPGWLRDSELSKFGVVRSVGPQTTSGLLVFFFLGGGNHGSFVTWVYFRVVLSYPDPGPDLLPLFDRGGVQISATFRFFRCERSPPLTLSNCPPNRLLVKLVRPPHQIHDA